MRRSRGGAIIDAPFIMEDPLVRRSDARAVESLGDIRRVGPNRLILVRSLVASSPERGDPR